MLKILGRISSINVRKVAWICAELGIENEREDWGAGYADPKQPEFLKLNPNGQIPVILDEGFVLWESNAILLYLAAKSGKLLPKDLKEQALVHQWLIWQVSELNPSWGYAVSALIRKLPGFDDQSRIDAAVVAWTRQMSILEGQLEKTGAYVAGKDFTVADIAIGLAVHRWLQCPIERKALPAVEAYYQRMKQRPAGAPWLSDETP